MTDPSVEVDWRRVYDAIVDQIRQAKLLPEAQLPSLPMLMNEHNATESVVRRAITELRVNGIVVTKQGRGVFVRQVPGDEQPSAEFLALSKQIAAIEEAVTQLAQQVAEIDQRTRPSKRPRRPER